MSTENNNDTVVKMLESFKSDNEKFQFIRAQQLTILDLTKKNKQLSEENQHLLGLVESAVPIIKSESDLTVGDDDEEIAKMELKKLKERSFSKELTLEEAKRTEIFSKILLSKERPVDNPKEREVRSIDVTDLLVLAEASEEKIKK